MAEETLPEFRLAWADEAIGLMIDVDSDGRARLRGLAPRHASQPVYPFSALAGVGDADRGLPLLDVVVAGTGRDWVGRRYCHSVVGGRMRYAEHSESDDGRWHDLTVGLRDELTGLLAWVTYRVLAGVGALQSCVRLLNSGRAPIAVQSVSSFLGCGLAGPGGELDDVEIWWAENDWLSEGRWRSRPFRDALPDLKRPAHGDPRSRFGVTNVGTWSAGTYLPMGGVHNTKTGYSLLWQVEHNGGWHWQVGERSVQGTPGSYVAALGPTDAEHDWRLHLEPGEGFETVPVGVAVSSQGLEGAVQRLTSYRRALRRPHPDHERLPVVFNDYMNTLMGDPTTERLMPLVDAAARAGAEYFCIDSGWYAEKDEEWWDTVGAWVPSKSRFPNGIKEVLEHIRARGMVPGLWIEPEVVGVRSPVADELPTDAFFTRGGERVVEQGRYQLDLCHPQARKHLDKAVDFMVGELGIGYLKMDYNIDIAPGTDSHDSSVGAGMLAHNRAVLDWLDAVLDRHPELTIENCSSGAMRTDYALLARCQLISTSDQQDALLYPPIAAAAPVAIAPEQAAVWAYPQPSWDDDLIAFTLCGAMLLRVHLSGFLDGMSPRQQQLVHQAIGTYKQIRHDIAEALPFWPLGLPKWDDGWLALGMKARTAAYIAIWRRPAGGDAEQDDAAPAEVDLHVPDQHAAEAEVLFPPDGARVDWRPSARSLHVTLPRAPGACVIRLT